jgi:hypothetical protein
VKFQKECTVQGLVCQSGHVERVPNNRDSESCFLAADLVADAGGRGSRAPRWLRELGFQSPAETSIGVDLAYASTKFRLPADCDRQERLIGFDWAIAPDCPNSGLLEIIEGDLWHVTLAGRFGGYPPHDEAGFLCEIVTYGQVTLAFGIGTQWLRRKIAEPRPRFHLFRGVLRACKTRWRSANASGKRIVQFPRGESHEVSSSPLLSNCRSARPGKRHQNIQTRAHELRGTLC